MAGLRGFLASDLGRQQYAGAAVPGPAGPAGDRPARQGGPGGRCAAAGQRPARRGDGLLRGAPAGPAPLSAALGGSHLGAAPGRHRWGGHRTAGRGRRSDRPAAARPGGGPAAHLGLARPGVAQRLGAGPGSDGGGRVRPAALAARRCPAARRWRLVAVALGFAPTGVGCPGGGDGPGWPAAALVVAGAHLTRSAPARSGSAGRRCCSAAQPPGHAGPHAAAPRWRGAAGELAHRGPAAGSAGRSGPPATPEADARRLGHRRGGPGCCGGAVAAPAGGRPRWAAAPGLAGFRPAAGRRRSAGRRPGRRRRAADPAGRPHLRLAAACCRRPGGQLRPAPDPGRAQLDAARSGRAAAAGRVTFAALVRRR